MGKNKSYSSGFWITLIYALICIGLDIVIFLQGRILLSDRIQAIAVVSLFFITGYYAVQTSKLSKTAEATLRLEASPMIFISRVFTNLNLREDKKAVEVTPFIDVANTGKAPGNKINIKYKYILADKDIEPQKIKESPYIFPQQMLSYKCSMQEFSLNDQEISHLKSMVGVKLDPKQNFKILPPLSSRKFNMQIEISYQDFLGQIKNLSSLAEFRWDDGNWGLITPQE